MFQLFTSDGNRVGWIFAEAGRSGSCSFGSTICVETAMCVEAMMSVELAVKAKQKRTVRVRFQNQRILEDLAGRAFSL